MITFIELQLKDIKLDDNKFKIIDKKIDTSQSETLKELHSTQSG